MSIFRTMMPYCFELREDGQYIALNRNYKPLGFKTNDWIDYEDYPLALYIPAMTEERALAVSSPASTDLKRIYLYDDGSKPTKSAANMTDYVRRLGILF